MRLLAAFSIIACTLVTACRSSDPQIVGSLSIDGNRMPQGTTDNSNSLEVGDVSTADDYGYSADNPILVGSDEVSNGPERERMFLNSLRGPHGETIRYERRGSCCDFKTENSSFGFGLLDVYEITYEGLDEPIVLYLNMYDPGELAIPKGFTADE